MSQKGKIKARQKGSKRATTPPIFNDKASSTKHSIPKSVIKYFLIFLLLPTVVILGASILEKNANYDIVVQYDGNSSGEHLFLFKNNSNIDVILEKAKIGVIHEAYASAAQLADQISDIVDKYEERKKL